MKLRIPYIIATLIAAFSIAYLANPPVLSAAPVLTVTSLQGKQINLAPADGKIRLVTFISPDCPISKKNLPVLDSIQQHNADASFEVLGITMPYDSIDQVTQFAHENNIGYSLVADVDGSIADAFEDVRFTPTSFLIDSRGNIALRIVGRLDDTELQSQIDMILQHPPLAQQSVKLSQ